MAFPSLTYIAQLPQMVRQELEQLLALFQGFLGTEHKEDGSHAAITADSISLGSDPLDGSFAGNVTGSLIPTTSTSDLGAVITKGPTGITLDRPFRNLRLSGTISWVDFVSGVLAGSPALSRSGFNLAFASDGTVTWTLTNGLNTHTLTFGRGTDGLTSTRTIAGNVLVATNQIEGNNLRITDGITAPTAVVGQAILYVDTADGDLKVIFGDGTVKTIVTD